MDAVEAVARAIYEATYPEGASWENWAVHIEQHGGYDGRDGSRKLAQAALSAARPLIAAECAELVMTVQFPDTVLGDNRRDDGKFKKATRLSYNTQPPRRFLAAAIKEQIR
jgi:hypothetical protein